MRMDRHAGRPRFRSHTAAALLMLGCLACLPVETRGQNPGLLGTEPFKQYWFAGQAEITRYELEQARYGEIHQGDAVLIFVTEDFLPDRQVKADSFDRSKTGALPILKLNATRNFNTGVYPYSMMTSVFTPLDIASHPRTLKTSTSIQEWCGHTYLQLNLRGARYRVQGYSYFESEGDRSFELEPAWLEDEIWTRIRVAPDSLPLGEVELVPGSQQSRLRHRELQVEKARASVEDAAGDVRVYKLEYAGSGRTLSIRFDARFPHEILGWEETYGSGSGPRAETLTTRAVRTHSIRTDYWSRNSVADAPLREKLGLD